MDSQNRGSHLQHKPIPDAQNGTCFSSIPDKTAVSTFFCGNHKDCCKYFRQIISSGKVLFFATDSLFDPLLQHLQRRFLLPAFATLFFLSFFRMLTFFLLFGFGFVAVSHIWLLSAMSMPPKLRIG
jgi:hypothetical protein